MLLPVNIHRPEWSQVRKVAAVIRQGTVVATPTDTVYGLAANPFNQRAVERIFRLKRRPETKPILLLIDEWARLGPIARIIPDALQPLAERFWPGPLTVIVPANSSLPDVVTAGTGNVAVRCSGSPFIRMLSRALRLPVTGTSANLSGLAPAITPDEVVRQFGARLCYVVDGGRSASRQVSTIVDLTGKPRVVRAGAIPARALEPYLR